MTVFVERRHSCGDDAGGLRNDRAAQVEPLPYLFHLRFRRQHREFVLPIANPANLVVFGGQMPALSQWLRYFTGPSLAAISRHTSHYG